MNGRVNIETAYCGLNVKSLFSYQSQVILTDVATRWQYMAT